MGEGDAVVGPSKAPVLAHEPRFEMCGVDDRCESSGQYSTWTQTLGNEWQLIWIGETDDGESLSDLVRRNMPTPMGRGS